MQASLPLTPDYSGQTVSITGSFDWENPVYKASLLVTSVAVVAIFALILTALAVTTSFVAISLFGVSAFIGLIAVPFLAYGIYKACNSEGIVTQNN